MLLGVLGIMWVLADAVLWVLLVTCLFYVGFFGFFLAARFVCNCPLFSSGQSHQSSCWRLNVLAACSKYLPSRPAFHASLR